jgi:hypothetical protein
VNANCISLPSKVLIFCRLHFMLENCSKYFGERKSFGTLPALTSTLHAIKIKLYIVSSESVHFTKNASWRKIQTLSLTLSCYSIGYSRAVDTDGIQTRTANSSKELRLASGLDRAESFLCGHSACTYYWWSFSMYLLLMVIQHVPITDGHSACTYYWWSFCMYLLLMVVQHVPIIDGHSACTYYWWSFCMYLLLMVIQHVPISDGHSACTYYWWSFSMYLLLMVIQHVPIIDGHSACTYYWWSFCMYLLLMVILHVPITDGRSACTYYWWSFSIYLLLMVIQHVPITDGHSACTYYWWSFSVYLLLMVIQHVPIADGHSACTYYWWSFSMYLLLMVIQHVPITDGHSAYTYYCLALWTRRLGLQMFLRSVASLLYISSVISGFCLQQPWRLVKNVVCLKVGAWKLRIPQIYTIFVYKISQNYNNGTFRSY